MAKKKEEKQIEKSPQEINRDIKTIANWDYTDTPSPKKERDIVSGQYVEVGEIKGFVSRIEGGFVFIEDSIQQGKLVKVNLKSFLKAFKQVKTKENVVSNVSNQGPANPAEVNKLKDGKSFAPKVDAKATKAPDQKLADKNITIASVGKFTDLANGFDSLSMKKSKISIDTPNNDDSLMKKNTKIKAIKSFTNLADDLDSSKMKKTKVKNTLSKSDDNSITKKNTKIKSFSDLNSNIQAGPYKNK